jgi:hypothetical protein
MAHIMRSAAMAGIRRTQQPLMRQMSTSMPAAVTLPAACLSAPSIDAGGSPMPVDPQEELALQKLYPGYRPW